MPPSEVKCEPKATGWDNGLCQDYFRELGRWFASRPGARRQVDEVARELRMPQNVAQSRPQGLANSTEVADGAHRERG